MGHIIAETSLLSEQKHFFSDVGDALTAIRSYKERLHRFSLEQKWLGHEPCDQRYPTELFALRPAHRTLPPLALIGGMGPLAGASGFERACRRFLNTREIVLFQACSIPDRTLALIKIAEARVQPSPEYALMLDLLESAIREAVAHVESNVEPVHLVALCNTSHFFLSETLRRLRAHQPETAARLRFVSLIEATIETIRQRGYRMILALYTRGTRLGRIYSQRFIEEGISYVEPTGTLEQSLMHSIFSGVKAFDTEASLAGGASLFDEILAHGREFDCVVAGCTEIPFILEALNKSGSEQVKAFLRRVEIIDPVSAALEIA